VSSKVLILVEGQTEETFIEQILAPHLLKKGIYPTASLVTTRRVKGGPDFKGGVVSYGKVKNDIINLLHDTSATMVTTMFDFYRLPRSFPGQASVMAASCYERAAYLENKLREDIRHRKFLPYLELYEFEAMLFASPEHIAQAFPNKDILEELRKIRAKFRSPEEINDKRPPSKRLLGLVPEYQKPLHGSSVILEIGLDRIRNECPHFDDWVTKLETLG